MPNMSQYKAEEHVEYNTVKEVLHHKLISSITWLISLNIQITKWSDRKSDWMWKCHMAARMFKAFLFLMKAIDQNIENIVTVLLFIE